MRLAIYDYLDDVYIDDDEFVPKVHDYKHGLNGRPDEALTVVAGDIVQTDFFMPDKNGNFTVLIVREMNTYNWTARPHPHRTRVITWFDLNGKPRAGETKTEVKVYKDTQKLIRALRKKRQNIIDNLLSRMAGSPLFRTLEEFFYFLTGDVSDYILSGSNNLRMIILNMDELATGYTFLEVKIPPPEGVDPGLMPTYRQFIAAELQQGEINLGKTMSSNAEDAVIGKLKEVLEQNKVTIFNEEEVATLKKVIDFWESWEAIGRAGKGLRNALFILVGIITGIIALKQGVVRWILNIVNQP